MELTTEQTNLLHSLVIIGGIHEEDLVPNDISRKSLIDLEEKELIEFFNQNTCEEKGRYYELSSKGEDFIEEIMRTKENKGVYLTFEQENVVWAVICEIVEAISENPNTTFGKDYVMRRIKASL